MAFQKQYTDSLQNICSFAFPANHLINFQLIRSTPNQSIQQSSAKAEYFSFITIAPGEGSNESRTYNFQNKINVKFSLQEIAGLSFVLAQWADGRGNTALPYTKFARSAQGAKTVSLWEPQQTNNGDGRPKSRMISITVKENNNGNGLTISLTPDQAYSISVSLQELFKKGISLEFERQMNAPRQTPNQGNSNSYNNFNNNNSNSNSNNNNNPFNRGNDFQSIANEFEDMLLR